MNLRKLHEAEQSFLMRYPDGFADPQMQAVRKKHNVDKLVEFTQANLTRTTCLNPMHVSDILIKIVSRSSMVSRFEKPPFKRFVDALDNDAREALAYAIEQRLFGRKQKGFELLVDMLARHKLAKWALVSVVPFYFAPRKEAFVKPTTAKGVIKLLEVDDLKYSATPTWAFYKGYRDLLTQVRKEIHPALSPNNAALSGFLMMQF